MEYVCSKKTEKFVYGSKGCPHKRSCSGTILLRKGITTHYYLPLLTNNAPKSKFRPLFQYTISKRKRYEVIRLAYP